MTKEHVQIFIAGDSTVADCPPGEEPRAGWGQLLKNFFTNNVEIHNYAIGGRSSKSFIEEGKLDQILEKIGANDYLFIQFGHNDQKDDHRKTEPYFSYQNYLKIYIDEAKKRKAIPVLITPMHRRTFDENGIIINSLGDYPLAMIQLAKKEKVPCINLWSKSKELYEFLGPEDSKKLFIWLKVGENPNYPKGCQDNTHFRYEGAEAMCKLITNEIKEKIPELSKLLL
ncbi:rhamnogalacturonan acetylesterase [Caldifermentibacillus hisashii]|uniref:rhamnogalacturonan acetylesterase n=1 Tax=Caldifermentibacillus hisashii TaxID=996558 RepID=UPI0031FE3220